MGVHGLWNLLEPVGKPVPLESLENKILAVDVSIWLHQATKGFRDSEGNPMPNAHLIGLCHRLCKLLFYKIKPVFVFDGGVPILKRQTMASRHSRREIATEKNSKLAEKILSNYIKSGIVNKKLGKEESQGTIKIPTRKRETDLFELPPLPVNNALKQSSTLESDSDEDERFADTESISSHMKGHNIHSVDVTSDAFRALPANIQHEILLELKDTRKQSSWNRLHQMPQEARDFSGFQMERLLKRRNLQLRLDEIVKEIGKNNDSELILSSGEVVQSQRMVSDSSTRYVLIKKALEKSPVKKTSSVSALKETEIVTIENDFIAEDLFALEEDGLTQQELLAIMESQKPTNSDVPTSSSSDDDLDFEEVPQPAPLSLHINPDESYSSEEDIFADVFSYTRASRKISSQDLGCEEMVNSAVSYGKASISSDASSGDFALVVNSSSELSQVPHKENEQQSQSQASFSNNFDANQMSSCSDDSDLVEISSHYEAVEPKFVREESSDIEEIKIQDNNVQNDRESSPLKKSNSDNSQTDLIHKDILQISSAVSHENPDLQKEIWNESDSDVSVRVEASSAAFVMTEESRAETSSQRKQELEELGRRIITEQEILIQEHGKRERLAASITDQMYAESQELLRLFGVPYLVAPMEAEAQCAFLDSAGLTQGTITDDSDIWLFGGRRVYKNFFNQGKFVEFFEEEDIYQVFKMKRDKLIHLALLTGSDYTEGIQGVGPVCALEILAEFPYEGIEALERFRDWLVTVQSKKNAPPENAVRQKLRNLQIKPGKRHVFSYKGI